jgi:hypothetical protein
MAIQPIDLQTLFTQLDKVAKSQSMQKEGLQLQQALQNVQIQKKTDEQAHAVNESQHIGEGAERINDKNARHHAGEEPSSRDGRGKGESGAEPEEEAVFQDPLMGKNIDFSG